MDDSKNTEHAPDVLTTLQNLEAAIRSWVNVDGHKLCGSEKLLEQARKAIENIANQHTLCKPSGCRVNGRIDQMNYVQKMMKAEQKEKKWPNAQK